MADDPKPDWLTPEVEAMFADPRFKHLQGLTDHEQRWIDSQTGNDYDSAGFLQAVTTLYAIRSAEANGRTMARATWALVFATVGLVVATVVLVVVTVTNG